jgi:rod shape determining protein RodA
MANAIGKKIDLISVSLYFGLVLIGWLMILSVEADQIDLSSFKSIFSNGVVRSQSIWILISSAVFFVCAALDRKFWINLAYPLYALGILLLLGVLVFGVEIKGATSWYRIASFSLQPSELAKVFTNLALAAYLGSYSISLKNIKTQAISIGLFVLPMLVILLQPDAGSALVFFAFFIVLYREGFPANFLITGIITLILLILGLRFDAFDIIAIIAVCGVIFLASQQTKRNLWFLLILTILTVVYFLFNNQSIFHLYGMLLAYLILTLAHSSKKGLRLPMVTLLSGIIASGVVFLADFSFDNLKPHQKDRINVWLNPSECDPQGSLYNLNQSKLAIGSGGVQGKGIFQGDLTAGNHVPEQTTDFIFCTIGEEQGFIGSAGIIILFILLILRLIKIAERQKASFSRVFAYGVACILFVHFFINIGMTMGLAPVIGIPLPFISKGGSSLLGFSMLMGILMNLDRHRNRV